MHPVTQTAREVKELKETTGHTIYTCLRPQFIIRKQHSRSSGGFYGREHDDVGRFGREYGYLVHISACHSSSSRARQITNAKAHDFSDSVLCGKMGDGAKINGRRKTTSRI